MCLDINRKARRRITLWPKRVYKVVILTKYNALGEFKTLYQDAYVDLGNTYKSKLIREHGFSCDEVSIGLHSFTSKKGAFHEEIHTLTDYGRAGNRLIIECTIPIFSRYYKGVFCGSKSIASTKLRYDRVVPKSELENYDK